MFPISAPLVPFPEGVSRAQVVRYLGLAAGELAAAGDLHAARVVAEAFNRLIDVEPADGAAVVDLAEERRKRP